MLTKNQQDLFNRRIYGNFVDDDGNIEYWDKVEQLFIKYYC